MKQITRIDRGNSPLPLIFRFEGRHNSFNILMTYDSKTRRDTQNNARAAPTALNNATCGEYTVLIAPY